MLRSIGKQSGESGTMLSITGAYKYRQLIQQSTARAKFRNKRTLVHMIIIVLNPHGFKTIMNKKL